MEKISPKFGIDDEVFYLVGKAIEKCIVTGLKKEEGKFKYITYKRSKQYQKDIGFVSTLSVDMFIDEEDLAHSKEELIEKIVEKLKNS